MASPVVPTNPHVTDKNGVSAGVGTDQNLPKNDLGRYVTVRNFSGAVLASDPVDWIWVPAWARAMVVYFNISFMDGTTPAASFQPLITDPTILDISAAGSGGGGTGNLGGASLTGTITSHGNVAATYMPNETGLADKITIGASGGSTISVNVRLPQLVGLKSIFVRTGADEHYTGSIGVEFYGRSKTQRGI